VPVSARLHAAILPRLAFALLLLAPTALLAGGPKYVAGVSFFNPGAVGRPVHWAGGKVNYSVDQGPLNSSVSNQQATAMVDAAAALWSAVPTAGVTLTNMGFLNEDVSGSNIAAANGVITAPADVTPSAANYPLGVIYDADGSVIDAVFGSGASQPTSCQNNGVWVVMDNLNPDATIAHASLILNGLCATNDNLLEMMSYELERAFGRILGLDYAQVNPGALTNGETNGTLGWPVMQPLSGFCSQTGGICLPNPAVLRYDDIAALNRIYSITAANLASFPGKQITATNTVSIQGTVSFRTGLGMQGVNVVARPLDASGNPLYQYAVSFVSGSLFNGNHGNPMTGWVDSDGSRLDRWGSNDDALQGFFDLSGMPLPPGMTTANYQITFEAIDPLYILTDSVGPYLDGQPTPSGTLAPITVPGLAAGSAQPLTVTAADSAAGGYQDAISTQASPRLLPSSGLWCGRLSQVGQSDWFTFPVRGGRTFTVVTQALDETGAPTELKAMPALGVWDAFDPVGATAVGAGPGMNGLATGESWLRVSSSGDDQVRIGIADQRGDGRPDYTYNGWVLYADTVSPQRLPASGGPIVIHGMGFRLADTVLVGGQPAVVTSISPNEITAIAPPALSGVSGSVDAHLLCGSHRLRRGQLRRGHRRLPDPAHSADEHGAHRRADALYRNRPGVGLDSGGWGHGHLHRQQRNGHVGLRAAYLLGGRNRRWPHHHECDRARRQCGHHYRFADQRRQPPGPLQRRNPTRSLRAHAPAFAGRRGYHDLDSPGSGAEQRCASEQSGGGLANAFHRHLGPEQHRRPHQLQRRRHQNPHRGPAHRGANRHFHRLPERHQPVRQLLRLRSTARICAAQTRLRNRAKPLCLGNRQPDFPSSFGYDRRTHGRRLGHPLPDALRLGSALPFQRPLRAGPTAGHADSHSHLRPGRNGHLQPCNAFRRGHQPGRRGHLRQHRNRQHRHRAASIKQWSEISFQRSVNCQVTVDPLRG
jgi:hypothetical protein